MVKEDIQEVYRQLFDKALEEYNTKQKRKDRRIKNYYEHINRNKQEKPFYELIFQIGNTEDTHCGTPEAALATKALTDIIKGFQERNPHIRVFNAVIHLDEETPHVHIDFVPFATEQKRGLSTRNSLSKALEQQGYVSEGKNEQDMIETVGRLTAENYELLQDVAKLREINQMLVSEKSALQKTIDRLRVMLRSVQVEVGYWKARYNKVMEFLEEHGLRKRWEELIKPKKMKNR